MVFSTNGSGTTICTHAKKESKYRFYTLQKINSKLFIDLKVKCKTIKLLEDNRGKNFYDIGHCTNSYELSVLPSQVSW